MNLGGGNFAGEKTVTSNLNTYYLGSVVPSDLDRDGNTDVVRTPVDTSTAGCDNHVELLHAIVNPQDILDVELKNQFQVSTRRPINAPGVYDAAVLDVNGDTKPDLWYGTCGGNRLFIQGRDTTDCNGNQIEDGCDILNGTSPDVNANGIPDECVDPQLAGYPYDRPKNRYISFNPTMDNMGTVAFRVELKQITLGSCNGGAGSPPETDFCRTDRGADDCNTCVGGALGDNSCITQAIDCSTGDTCTPTGETCVNDAPKAGGSNVGQVWWVGPEAGHTADDTLAVGVHLLVSQAFRKESDDWPNPVHVSDCEIVPQAVYGVTAVDVVTQAESAELLVATTQFAQPGQFWWGDAVGPLKKFCGDDIRTLMECIDDNDCTPPETCDLAWTLPDEVVNLDDVTAVLWKSENNPGFVTPHITWVDVHGNNSGTAGSQNFDPPNYKANTADIQELVQAFEGRPYTYYDPADCPNTAGTLTVTDIAVDQVRSDYIFKDEPSPLEAKNLPEMRLGSSLSSTGPGVTKTGQVYLATFTFQPTGGANGVFTINVVGETKSFLLNPDGSTQETDTRGTTVVGYGIDCLNDPHCDDMNECTDDTCSANNECQYGNVASGTACDDGLWCTRSGSTCDGAGNCTGGAPQCPPGYFCSEGGQQCFGAGP